MPGNRIIVSNGRVRIDGLELDVPCTGRVPLNTRAQSYTIPSNQYYVIGDNRGSSHDSRVFGPVPVEAVVGRAWLAFRPPQRVAFLRSTPLNSL